MASEYLLKDVEYELLLLLIDFAESFTTYFFLSDRLIYE